MQAIFSRPTGRVSSSLAAVSNNQERERERERESAKALAGSAGVGRGREEIKEAGRCLRQAFGLGRNRLLVGAAALYPGTQEGGRDFWRLAGEEEEESRRPAWCVGSRANSGGTSRTTVAMTVGRKAAGFAVGYGVTMLMALLAVQSHRRRKEQLRRKVRSLSCFCCCGCCC